MIGDWLGASEPANAPLHAFILHVKDGIALDWTDFDIAGSVVTSGNSVYQDTAVGVFLTDPSTGTNGYVATIPCFVSGTRIATPDRMVAVERLRAGMLVMTTEGVACSITWLGHRKVACKCRLRPASVWPVRVRAGAFADNVPERDLWLSPDHAIYANGVLIPIRYLVDGTTIAQVSRSTITYWHIELTRHAIILAEGLPVESYLDTGDRSAFSNGGTVMAMFPDFAIRTWEAMGCAPLVVVGPEVAALRDLVAARRRGNSARSVRSRLYRIGSEDDWAQSAVGIDHGVTLAAVDFLACIITPGATGFGGLDALAVDDRRTRAGLAADTLAIQHHQVVVEGFPGSVVAKPGEPAIGRLVRREMLRQHAPGTAAAQHKEDRIHHFAHRPAPMPAGLGRRWQQRREYLPLGVGQVTGVAQVVPVMLCPGLGGPHRRLQG